MSHDFYVELERGSSLFTTGLQADQFKLTSRPRKDGSLPVPFKHTLKRRHIHTLFHKVVTRVTFSISIKLSDAQKGPR